MVDVILFKETEFGKAYEAAMNAQAPADKEIMELEMVTKFRNFKKESMPHVYKNNNGSIVLYWEGITMAPHVYYETMKEYGDIIPKDFIGNRT